MNSTFVDWTEFFRSLATEEPLIHAGEAYRDSCAILLHVPGTWGGGEARRIHIVEKNAVFDALKNEQGLAQLIKNFHGGQLIHLRSLADWNDPLVSANAESLFSTISGTYQELGLPASLAGSVEAVVDGAIAALVREAAGQVSTLVALSRDLIRELHRIGMAQRRVVLVELPVGNSLVTKLFEHALLDSGFDVLRLTISVSRSDADSARVRFRDTLRTQVESVSPMNDDLFVYLDEWQSGANFAKVSQLLSKIVGARKPRAHVLAVGLLAAGARDHPRFGSFAKKHDKLLESIGLVGSRFRITMPSLSSRFKLPSPFFGGERDRLAGYRKMQLWGAIFSTMDQTVERLHSDGEALEEARLMSLAAGAENGGAVSAELVVNRKAFQESFEESYQAYRTLRTELKDDDDSHWGVSGDVERPIRSLIAKLVERVTGTRARMVVVIASVYGHKVHLVEYDHII